MNVFYYKLAKKFVFVGVLFFVSHLLFPQYTQAATITEDQVRIEFSEMNISNSSESIIYDKTDSDVTTIRFIEPATTTATSAATATRAPALAAPPGIRGRPPRAGCSRPRTTCCAGWPRCVR